MKTDRDLLALAAKAAGLNVHYWGEPGREKFVLTDIDITPRWDPLSDDGDALRLAVELGLHVQPSNGSKRDISEALVIGRFADGKAEAHEGDKFAATRRAIVRAAAAIGESMP